MGRMSLTSGAELLEEELTLNLLLVLAGIVIDASASGALKPCEIF